MEDENVLWNLERLTATTYFPLSSSSLYLFAERPPLLLSLLLAGADLPLELSLERLQCDLQPQPGVLRLRQLLLQLLRLSPEVLGFCL